MLITQFKKRSDNTTNRHVRLHTAMPRTPNHLTAGIQLIFTGASRPFPSASPPCFALTFSWSPCLLCPFVSPRGNISHSGWVIYLLPFLALGTIMHTHEHARTRTQMPITSAFCFFPSVYLPFTAFVSKAHKHTFLGV